MLLHQKIYSLSTENRYRGLPATISGIGPPEELMNRLKSTEENLFGFDRHRFLSYSLAGI
jgi:hypothetical protein